MTRKYVAQPTSNLAISHSDHENFGCPVCMSGNKRGYSTLSAGACTVFICSKCNVSYIICSDGIDRSNIGVNESHPEIFDHPNKSLFQIKYMIQALRDKDYELYFEKQIDFDCGCNPYIWMIWHECVSENQHALSYPQGKENIVIRMLNGALNELSKSKSQ